MERIRPYQQFENEKYSCRYCDRSLNRDEIKNWKCPDCGNRTIIAIPNEFNHSNYLVRMLPSDLKKSDTIYLFETGFHIVLDVNDNFIEERIYAILKGFGSVEFKNTWINVMWNDNEIVD